MASSRKRTLTEEQKQIDKYKEEYKEPVKTLEWQLGWAYGCLITANYMPSLSVDSIRTWKCIDVTGVEETQYNRLRQLWSDLYESNKVHQSDEAKKAWDIYRSYGEELKQKYMPDELECRFWDRPDLTDWTDFKRGMIDSLWDSDVCQYDCCNLSIVLGGTTMTILMNRDKLKINEKQSN